ncbi:unnamed protein product, partial [marine sediment metagenome]
NDSSNSYIYYNESTWVEFGTGSGGGIWTNSSGVATYGENVSVTGNISTY